MKLGMIGGTDQQSLYSSYGKAGKIASLLTLAISQPTNKESVSNNNKFRSEENNYNSTKLCFANLDSDHSNKVFQKRLIKI